MANAVRHDTPVPQRDLPRNRGAATRRPVPPLVAFAVIVLIILIVLALLGQRIAPFDYQQTDISHALQPPFVFAANTPVHLLGTDALGRDLWSRLLFSIQVTFLVALVGTLIGFVLGTTLGLIAGYAYQWMDDVIMLAVDAQASLPFMVFALAALAVLGNSFVTLLIVVGLTGWDHYARLARGLVLSVQEREYVMAARSLGITTPALFRRHLFPNMLGPILVQFSLSLASTILLETALSFLNLGIQPPMTSLGQMLGDGRDYLLFAPWIAVIPGVVIFLVVLSITVLGDWLHSLLTLTSH